MINSVVPKSLFTRDPYHGRIRTMLTPLFYLVFLGLYDAIADLLIAHAVNNDRIRDDQRVIGNRIQAFGMVNVGAAAAFASRE